MGDRESTHGGQADPECPQVRDVVRAVVAQTAPGELQYVEDLEEFEDAEILDELENPSRGEPLGFGAGDFAAVATTVLWLVLGKFAERLADGGVTATSKGLKALFRKRRKRSEKVTVPALTRPQLEELRTTLLVECRQRGFADDQAESLTNAVVVRMVLRPEAPELGSTHREQG
ncbi:hypothetical protein [Glycomyces niveus]|uniref:Uncharacterized protein n=1 Tax=Glycomyces niveus TaxID=2820287 RepID=A0ABS3U7G5_9ACTN|nr:hypothetical protein [Glycomyces sp. NEAU-S30]MBO3734381.1 hypothetical protein [Glycomyces sp. NEAU-S30]